MNCDGCTACCTILPIEDTQLIKLENVTCTHCDKGCTIYESRPESCVNFECVYIQDGYSEEIRPDKSGVIFDKLTTRIYQALISRDRLDSWDTEPMRDYIRSLNDQGISVVVSDFKRGITEIRNAKEHDPNKVFEISLGYYK